MVQGIHSPLCVRSWNLRHRSPTPHPTFTRAQRFYKIALTLFGEGGKECEDLKHRTKAILDHYGTADKVRGGVEVLCVSRWTMSPRASPPSIQPLAPVSEIPSPVASPLPPFLSWK